MLKRSIAAAFGMLASGGLALAAPASPVDGQYAFKGSVGNNFEIQSSRLALRSSDDPSIRAFARRMILDHTKAQAELGRAAAAAGADTGPFLDDAHQAKLTTLSGLSGADFDQAYVADQVEAHHEALQLLDDIAATGSDAGIRTWAAKTKPAVVRHLQMIGRMPEEASM